MNSFLSILVEFSAFYFYRTTLCVRDICYGYSVFCYTHYDVRQSGWTDRLVYWKNATLDLLVVV